MSQTIAVPTRVNTSPSVPRASVSRSGADRLFYLIVSIAMLLFTAVGFRAFLLHGKSPSGEVTSRIFTMVVIHGIAMFAWVAVFFMQTALIQTGRRKLHMVIGPFALLIAATVVILGSVVAALSVHFNPQLYVRLGGAKSFLAIMWTEMFAFAAFVALGWWYRRKPAIHRTMMLLGTLVMLSGALSRCPYLGYLQVPPFSVWGPVLALGTLLFFLQWALTRTPNRVYLIGLVGIALAALFSAAIAGTSAWARLAATIIP